MSQRIKTEPPWLAKAAGPDLRPRIWPVAKGIIQRNRVRETGISVIDINAKHFAEEDTQVLTMPLRILLRPGVTHANIEKTIRPKCDATATVVLRDTFHFDQPARRRT